MISHESLRRTLPKKSIRSLRPLECTCSELHPLRRNSLATGILLAL
jgi:hypothetical protein